MIDPKGMKKDLLNCIIWTKDFVEKSGCGGVVVGLSGGIDSTVVASLCVEALGYDKVIGVIMPCDSQITDEIHASELAVNLGITLIDMPLDDTFSTWFSDYKDEMIYHIKDEEVPDFNKMVKANAKARLRMTTLYAVANQCNYLVVGTTNKSEAMIGYATKYGDGGVDFEPIQDFYKTEVYELAKLLDVPNQIIEKAPSAGLWDGQTDEEEIGMTYYQLDHILAGIETGYNFRMTSESRLKINEKVEKMIKAAKHKELYLPYYVRE